MEAKFNQSHDFIEEITCCFTTEEVELALNKAIQFFSRSVKIDGFRAGKVPPKMIELQLGEQINFKALEFLSNKAGEAIHQKQGDLLAGSIEDGFDKDEEYALPKRGEPFTLSYSYAYVPEVELPSYKKVKVDFENSVVTDEEVSTAMEGLLRQSSGWRPSERTSLQDGDTAVLSILAEEGGKKILSADTELYYMLPNLGVLKALEDVVRGLAVGETIVHEMTFPANEDHKIIDIFAGRTCTFTITLTGIEEPTLLTWTPELVKEFGFDSLDALKEKYREVLQQQKDFENRGKLQTLLVEHIMEEIIIPGVPTVMSQTFKDAMYENISSSLVEQGLSLSVLVNAEKRLENQIATIAEKMANVQIVLLNIAKKESISVTDEEFGYYIQMLAREMQTEPKKLYEEYRDAGVVPKLKSKLLADKVAMFILQNADMPSVA